MAAFDASIAADRPIEMDVHLLADDHVVVFHDETLDRMTASEGPLTLLTRAEVTRLRLLGGGEGVPLLSDVLDLVEGKVPLLIEIKDGPRRAELCLALSEELESYQGQVAIQSFDPFAVRWFAENFSTYPRGQISSDFRGEKLAVHKKFILRHLLTNRFARPHFVSYDHRALPFWAVGRVRRLHTPVLAWTIRSGEEARKVRPYCDNIIFEGYTV